MSDELVRSFDVNSLPPAIWPAHPEIAHHLNYKPYIELDIRFDTKRMLEESFAVLDKFVAHRNYAVTSKSKSEWKSTGIQAIDGDHTKTSYHTNYGIKSNPNYQLTEVADLCPETVKFLCSITDLNACERVRFMLLEPGAKIHVHKDSDDDVCTAINISLNMPEGCRFVADANEDGSFNAYTVEIPFKDSGSVVLFNNSKYHFVENNSDKPRMHIIFHGPVRYPVESIIADARKQNGFSNDREVLQALIRKKYELGETIRPDSDLYKEWKTLGISNDIIPEDLKIVVVDEPLENREIQEECLYRITGASVFPLRYDVVKSEELDHWMAHATDNIGHVIIIGSGLLINDVNRFVLEIFRAIADMKNEKAMISGQIINHKNAIPYLHEQLLILDYQMWKENGRISLGKKYDDRHFEFPGYLASEENIHDDYTPLYIESDANVKPKIGPKWWGTQLLAECINRNIKALNIPRELRETKKYAYPAAKEKWQYEDIKKDIEERLEYINKQVFFFNNEELRVRNLVFQPTRFITVSAGLKPFGIYRQFWRDDQPADVFVVDYSAKAIEYLSGLTRVNTPSQLFDYIKGFMSRHPYGSTLDDDGIRVHLQAILAETFDNDVNLLVNEIQKLSSANFIHADFIQNPEAVVDLFDKNIKTLFWHSNAWNCNGILYKMTPMEIEDNYLSLVHKIKDKLGLPAWKHTRNYEIIFGESIQNIHSFMTEGAIGNNPVEVDWSRLWRPS